MAVIVVNGIMYFFWLCIFCLLTLFMQVKTIYTVEKKEMVKGKGHDGSRAYPGNCVCVMWEYTPVGNSPVA